ncbi:MAG: LytTR family DNA-binding domain-containing protein [Eubacteriaceae bacterium]|jgi:DNA-binding LytR/AlgR family response regulator|nr:LytTR family DNA-binding domain-containing protein [Eubacteriaceae bacterium]
MKIIICGEDKRQLVDCHDKIIEHTRGISLDFEVTMYDDAAELLHEIQRGNFSADIAYLEITMSATDGIEIARRLHEVNPRCRVIFHTEVPDHWDEAFSVGAVDYLVKGRYTPERFAATLRKCIESCRDESDESVIFTRSGTNIIVPISSIHYFDVLRKETTVHFAVKDGMEHFSFYSPMRRIEEIFSVRGFLRVHRDYLVQKDYIKCISGSTIMLTSGDLIPIGRTYKENIRGIK